MVFSADETTDVGRDEGTPVSPDHTGPGSRFTGRIHWVQLDLGADGVLGGEDGARAGALVPREEAGERLADLLALAAAGPRRAEGHLVPHRVDVAHQLLDDLGGVGGRLAAGAEPLGERVDVRVHERAGRDERGEGGEGDSDDGETHGVV